MSEPAHRNIVRIDDPALRSEICDSILRGLPLWFGIESAIVEYVHDVRVMETWAVYGENTVLGFASIKKHFPQSAEVRVMGVLDKLHRKGIGQQLLATIEAELRGQGFRFLTVKTLPESRPNIEYDQTRNFYMKAGFTPLEEFSTLWGADNPCLLLIKSL